MGVSRIVLSRTVLALLRQTSMPPNRATVAATAASTCSSSRMSQTSGSAAPPAFSICLAAVWIVPGSLGCGWVVLAAIAILAPSRAARSAIALPMPRLAPVMNRVFPLSVVMLDLIDVCRTKGNLAQDRGGNDAQARRKVRAHHRWQQRHWVGNRQGLRGGRCAGGNYRAGSEDAASGAERTRTRCVGLAERCNGSQTNRRTLYPAQEAFWRARYSLRQCGHREIQISR